MTQMVLAEDDEMIEAFPLDREDPALGVSVQVRRSWTDLDDVALLAGQDGVELGGEFGVEVVNQVRGPIRLLLGEEHEVPGLLGDPARIRVQCHAGNNHAQRADVEEEG
jgi:hypothetical protein